MFRRHTAHHQELKNCNCSLWFYICLWLPAAVMAQSSQRPATKNVSKTRGCNYNFWAPDDGRCVAHSGRRQPKTYVKPEDAITVFELLMMGGLSPETCWAIKKQCNNKFYYTVAFCWFFLRDLKVYILMLVHLLVLSIKFSIIAQVRILLIFRNTLHLTVKYISIPAQQPNWSTTPCRGSTTAYSRPAQPVVWGQHARGGIWIENQI